MSEFIPALIFLVLIAALVRDDTVLTLCYFMAAVYVTSRWWSRRAFNSIKFTRVFTDRAFPNETVSVRLEVNNRSLLPVVWLSLYEGAVPEISGGQSFREVISLGPRGRKRFEYTLHPYKRGYYPVGPLFLHSGDLFGLSDDALSQGASDHLTVYPRIVPLARLGLPSRSPLGTLRHTQPIFEDPARVIGKRDYVNGDSLRRVDWKATAASGRLQVKQLEPSIALEALIALDLRDDSYDRRARYDDSELAIVVAASVANHIINQKQPVGLLTNARDATDSLPHPRSSDGGGQGWGFIPARNGRSHLMRLLEILARAQTSNSAPALTDLLANQIAGLPWGATLILITSQADDSLLDSLFHARRAGLNAVVILVGHGQGFSAFRSRAGRFGFTVYEVARERDMVSPSTL